MNSSSHPLPIVDSESACLMEAAINNYQMDNERDIFSAMLYFVLLFIFYPIYLFGVAKRMLYIWQVKRARRVVVQAQNISAAPPTAG